MENQFSSEPEAQPAPELSCSVQEELAGPVVQENLESNNAEATTKDEGPGPGSSVQENLEPNNGEPENDEDSLEVRPPTEATRDLAKFGIQLDSSFDANKIVRYIPLSQCDSEYGNIYRLITNKRRFRVDSIEKIENPYLKKAYELKKEQKEMAFGRVEERLVFHGTSASNLDGISKFNFDWRLNQKCLFGKGVNFSPNANYASNFPHRIDDDDDEAVMVVAKVMIAKSCLGKKFMVLPDDGCDTTHKLGRFEDMIVIVKYEDNEFYPVYKINYHLNRKRSLSDSEDEFWMKMGCDCQI